jgi:hypothetical protein
MTMNPFAALVARNRAAATQGQSAAPVPQPIAGAEAAPGATVQATSHATPPGADSIPPEVESMIASLIDDDDEPGQVPAQLVQPENQPVVIESTGPAAAVDTPTDATTAVASIAAEGTTRLFVLNDAGSYQMNQILSGVVGTVDDAGKFKIHDDYKKLSYLFTLAEAGQLPTNESGSIDASSLAPVVLPESVVPAFLASMVSTSSANWSRMYEAALNMGGHGGNAVGRAMVEQERNNTERAVATYLSGLGMQLWSVPVVYGAHSVEEQPAHRATNEAGLIESACNIRNVQIFTGGEVVQVQPQPEQAQPPGELQVQAPATEPGEAATPSWVNHVGPLSLVIEGEMRVLAPSAEIAAQVVQAQIDVRRTATRLPQLQLNGHSIQNVELEEPTPDETYRDGPSYD